MEIDEDDLYLVEEKREEEDNGERGQPAEELETVLVGEGDPLRIVKVGTTMGSDLRNAMEQLLQKYRDIFAWSHKDMPKLTAKSAFWLPERYEETEREPEEAGKEDRGAS
ncbi:hypothetical protein LWI29_012436 [Acer saccharum]|uniref:Uncharacterized protein n=1 Tax=Acer saccharum TaxID=4024 RepID=A0AA39S3E3_ACESA|nr:hypothetical protein LWI29_012436 [Acer saccharum]